MTLGKGSRLIWMLNVVLIVLVAWSFKRSVGMTNEARKKMNRIQGELEEMVAIEKNRGKFDRYVEAFEKLPVGESVALNELLEFCNSMRIDAPPAALVGKRRVGESITNHAASSFQFGTNDPFEVFCARSKHQQ